MISSTIEDFRLPIQNAHLPTWTAEVVLVLLMNIAHAQQVRDVA